MTSSKINAIDVHDLKNKMDNNPLLCLIDVRELDEWQAMHIPGALHVPKDMITHQITSIAPDFDHPIYLHCRSGMRSLSAAECLTQMGYQQVYSVSGGIIEWAKSGYPIE